MPKYARIHSSGTVMLFGSASDGSLVIDEDILSAEELQKLEEFFLNLGFELIPGLELINMRLMPSA